MMQAADLMSTDFPVLSAGDAVQKAVDIFMDTCVCHIPIVGEGGQLEGLLPIDFIVPAADRNQPVSDFKADWQQVYAYPDQHGLFLFEILSKLELSALPVVDENRKYQGVLLTTELLSRLSSFYSFREPGGIITLIMGVRDYNLGEIARIVESNNAKILTLYMDMDNQMEQMKLTLKITTTDLSHIIATFERYKYTIEYYTHTASQRDEMQERYDLLMKLFDL